MSEELLNNTFQNKLTGFIKKNIKTLIILFILLILTLFSYFFYQDLQKRNEIKLSQQYTQASIQFKEKKIDNAKQLFENIINKNHKFYSPLALYFIIDNNLEIDPLKIIIFFDKILSISSIDEENLNLIRIKKAIFLFSLEDEELMTKTLNPIINSDSVWRNIAIELISDYFLSKNQEIKASEYKQLLNNKKKD
jgi:predicted negative regulator of RcsB-dependent stress response